MTAAEFWSVLPTVVFIALVAVNAVLLILAPRRVMRGFGELHRRVFPPDQSDQQALDRLTVRQSESLEFKNFRTMQRAERWPADVSERVH